VKNWNINSSISYLTSKKFNRKITETTWHNCSH